MVADFACRQVRSSLRFFFPAPHEHSRSPFPVSQPAGSSRPKRMYRLRKNGNQEDCCKPEPGFIDTRIQIIRISVTPSSGSRQPGNCRNARHTITRFGKIRMQRRLRTESRTSGILQTGFPSQSLCLSILCSDLPEPRYRFRLVCKTNLLLVFQSLKYLF